MHLSISSGAEKQGQNSMRLLRFLPKTELVVVCAQNRNQGGGKTRSDTQLPKSRAGGQVLGQLEGVTII